MSLRYGIAFTDGLVVIAANQGRLGKTLFTDLTEGEKLRLIGHWDGDEEARWIGEEVEAYSQGTRGHEPVGLDGIAILVRASFQMRAFEDRFLTIGLPYRVIGGYHLRLRDRSQALTAFKAFMARVAGDPSEAHKRVYVKAIRRGVADAPLSAEEERALKDAGITPTV